MISSQVNFSQQRVIRPGVFASTGSARTHLVLTLALMLVAGTPSAGTITEVAPRGSNPGNLNMYLYLPERLRSPAALVVVLHGCAQGAHEHAVASGWTRWAQRWGFLLLLPEQKRRNNLTRCFNWFRNDDNRRQVGEAHSIYQMIGQVRRSHPVDEGNIFITGVSAGGAMANAMLVSYPEVFRGGGLFAAVPYGCASGLLTAVSCMLGRVDNTPQEWAERIRDAASGVPAWPDVVIWHGDADRIVAPHNATELEEQWRAVHQLEGVADEEARPEYVRRVFRDVQGRIRVETYLIRGMGHGTPVDPGELSTQCGEASRFFPDVDVCASYRLARSWGLLDSAGAGRADEMR
jgi:poly(hydroxyalkanoate) depolymerase family esterase